MMTFFWTRSSFEVEAAQEVDGSSDDDDIIMAQSSDEEDEASSSSGKDVPAPSAEKEVRESITVECSVQPLWSMDTSYWVSQCLSWSELGHALLTPLLGLMS